MCVENILLTSRGDEATLKIADFGFASQCCVMDSLNNVFTANCNTLRGTPGYVAPEILMVKTII